LQAAKSVSPPPKQGPNPRILREETLSVIIPAFGASEYIEACLDSIVSQNYEKLEILVGVDNCPDTLSKLKEISHKYSNLRIFSTNRSVGPYVIRNSLVELSKYNNLLFFDADDIMRFNLIIKLRPHFNGGSIIRFKYFNFTDASNIVASSKIHRDVAHGIFFIPKHIFEKIGGFQPWRVGADTEFIKRSSVNSIKTVEINLPLFYRRIHPNSLTQHSATNHKSTERNRIRQWIKNNRDWKIPIFKTVTELNQIKQ
jgi:glycosyltransferase involved in cell wall biosynthesis